jgi:hypothetical protein
MATTGNYGDKLSFFQIPWKALDQKSAGALRITDGSATQPGTFYNLNTDETM